MLLTQDQEMIRDAVRAFAQEELWPHAARGTRSTLSPRPRTRAWPQLGAYGICVPEEYGGAGLDYLTLALVLEEIAAGDGGTSTAISVTNCPVNAILMRYGNEAQKQQWLAPAGARRDAGRLLPDRAARGQRRLQPAHHGREGGRWLRASTASSSSSPAARTATWPSSLPSPTRARARRA
jgi:alkylation response protein AidB-like acyl-CoA dehydrogenase